MKHAVEIEGLSHYYGTDSALKNINLCVPKGVLFGLLGPNGGGKTTLFKLISTLLRPRIGDIWICGKSVRKDPSKVRSKIGVVFQSPSLDGKLTVLENLRHHGHMLNLWGKELKAATQRSLYLFELTEKASTLVEKLSGGFRRRVELAKIMLSSPRVLLLDEPTVGLDPLARNLFWNEIQKFRSHPATVLFTTHLLEEAEACDEIAILDRGTLVSRGAPASLKSELQGDVLSIESETPEVLSRELMQHYGLKVTCFEQTLRVDGVMDAAELSSEILLHFSGMIRSMRVSKPTLEDYFIHKTGHKFNGS